MLAHIEVIITHNTYRNIFAVTIFVKCEYLKKIGAT